MKIYSEKTGKQYQTVKECLNAEKVYDAEIAKQEAKKTELAEARKSRAKEVEDAFTKAQKAKKDYLVLRDEFVKDYGSFHMTFTDANSGWDLDNFFGDFLRFF